jgi:hypothetical protein
MVVKVRLHLRAVAVAVRALRGLIHQYHILVVMAVVGLLGLMVLLTLAVVEVVTEVLALRQAAQAAEVMVTALFTVRAFVAVQADIEVLGLHRDRRIEAAAAAAQLFSPE